MLIRFSCRHNAMATVWEAVLWGDDEEHLAAVAAAVWDEIDRVERLLSRFDPASEVSRVNRLAGQEAVRVSVELSEILQTCIDAHRWTNGFFDITAVSRFRRTLDPQSELPLKFNNSSRTVRFSIHGVVLDFGAFGKGYAIDRAVELLKRYNVSSALLHGGTSSITALGSQPNNVPWPISICGSDYCKLNNASLSISATRHPGQTVSDIINPITSKPLTGNAACAVIAPEAVTAEILSTACLAMGFRGIENYIDNYLRHQVLINWLDLDRPSPTWHWFI